MTKAKRIRKSATEPEPTAGKVAQTDAAPRQEAMATMPARPGGKLGLMIDHLGTDAGASADELAVITGWRKNSVLGALSRLRLRGFALELETTDKRRAYRLARREA